MILYDYEATGYVNRNLPKALLYSPTTENSVSDPERYFEPSFPYGSSYIVHICSRCGRIVYAEPIVAELYCNCGASKKMSKQKRAVHLSQIPYNKIHVWGGMPVHWSIIRRNWE